METAGGTPFFRAHVRALETSLVEWKPVQPAQGVQGRGPLETSLVEWKQPLVRDMLGRKGPWKLP